MGASKSKSKAEINNTVINESYNKCPSTTAINQASIKNVVFQPMDTCTSSTFNIDQSASVDATCLISAMQESLASVINKMDTTAKAGIGYANAKSNVEINNILKNKIENECSGASPTNIANVQDTIIRACDFKIIQNATAKQACQIGALQKATLDASNAVSTTAIGWDPTLFSIVLLAIVIIIAILVYVFKSSGQSSAVEGAGQYMKDPNIGSPELTMETIYKICMNDPKNQLCSKYLTGGFNSQLFSFENIGNNKYKVPIILGLLLVFYFLLQNKK